MDANSYQKGLSIRREILGDQHVDKAVGDGTGFDQPLQEFIGGFAWGELWSRPNLTRRERSLVTLGMLSAAPPSNELRAHILGALRNSATREEICEVFLHTAVYLGFPRAIESFRIAKAALAEVDADPTLVKTKII